MYPYYLVTGAPGSGKTAVLSQLAKQGFLVVAEAARAVLSEQRAVEGEGVYDRNPALFKELLLSRAMRDYNAHQDDQQPVFFDRGIPDVIAYADCFGLPPGAEIRAAARYRYNKTVFFAPSWEAIYTNDQERRLSFVEAAAFGRQLKNIYQSLGYDLLEMPCVSPEDRMAFILDHVAHFQ